MPRVPWIAGACVGFAALLFSQSFTGSVSGIVTDSTGAVLAGAAITVTDVAQNTKHRTVTNDTGFYLISGMAPGLYQLSVEKAGFRTYVLDSMPLTTQQKASVDISLQVGSVVENVEVKAEAQMVDPDSSTIGAVIENKRIVDLPLNGRNIYHLASLVPGVANARTGNSQLLSDFSDANRFSVNGGQEATNEILLDGVTAMVSSTSNSTLFAVAAIPSIESIQEFRIQTNMYAAEYGRSGGGVVTMVTKSGSNSLHGSAYEFLRNSYFDANNFFANSSGAKLASFKRNQFGGTLGGPVFIPKVYDGHNKTFFFFSYESQRVLQARLDQETLPTALERAGDFSQDRAANGALKLIFDPATTRPNPDVAGAFIRDPFAGNRIPGNRLNPVALKAQQFFPEANNPGLPFTSQLNFVVQQAGLEPTNRLEAKVDHYFDDRKHIFGRYTRLGGDYGAPDYWSNPAANGVGLTHQTMTNAALDYTQTLNNSTVLNLRYGLSRLFIFRPGWGPGFSPTDLGLPSSIANVTTALAYPVITIQNYAGQGQQGVYFRSGITTHSFLGNIAKVSGRHSLKFGIDSRINYLNVIQPNWPDGGFNFANDMTQGPNPRTPSATAGDGYASFLLGTGSSGQISHDVASALANRYIAWYAQDDFKLSSRLTINLGFRWDFETGVTERYNRLTAIDPTVHNPVSSQVGFDVKGGYLFAGGSLGRRSLAPVYPRELNPRIGLAYQLNSKTVIRTGYGIFFDIASDGPANSWTGTPFQSTTTWLTSLDGITPYNQLSNPFPSGYNLPQGSAPGLLAGIGQNLFSGMPSSFKTPYNQQWNFTIQRSLGKDMVWEIAYAGNKGTNLPLYLQTALLTPNMNQLLPSQLALGSQLLQLVSNPFYGIINSGTLSTPTVQRGQLLRPFPEFLDTIPINANWGNSNYHALQTRFEKRFSKGLSAMAAFTWSKTITDGADGYWNKVGTSMTNWYCRSCDRAVSSYDQPKHFVTNFTYELPLGRGKSFGSGWNRALDGILGQWQVNGILTVSEGLPLRFTVPQNTSFSFGGNQRPDFTGKDANLGDQKTLKRWFDTSSFILPQQFTFGNLGRNVPSLRGSTLEQVDFSVFKSFPIKERLHLQFRGEAFNLANHPLFSDPGTQVTSPTFGVVTAQENAPRQIQLSLKLLF